MPSVDNLVHEESSSTGTGNFTLANVQGRRPFNTAFGNGVTTNVFFYFISHRGEAEYEWGTGHMSNATTLVRDTVLGGSNGTSAVSFSPGAKDVTNALPAVSYEANLASVKSFGAKGDGTTDDTAAFTAALAASKNVYIPPGTYRTTSAIIITQSGTRLWGAGRHASIINVDSTTAVGLTTSNSLTGLEISGFRLTRTGTAGSSAHGFVAGASLSKCLVQNLLIDAHYVGIVLQNTDFSILQDCITEKNLNNGLTLNNIASDGACQWQISRVLSQMNEGIGFAIASIAGPAGVTLGDHDHIATFANTGRGYAVLGSSGVPINGVRLSNAFIGEDADSEIYLDTYGRLHKIECCFVELAGRRTTGPTLATTATGLGDGIEITANNIDVQITSCRSDANSLDGIRSAGTRVAIVAPIITNNGQASSAGNRYGIDVTAGRCEIIGGISGNTGAGSSQIYGIHGGASVTKLQVIGIDGTNNATGDIDVSAMSAADYLLLTDAHTALPGDVVGGAWTPAITFDDPGNLNVAYSTQVGTYKRIGDLIILTGNITTSTFTHTSASGNLRVSGLPFAATNTAKAACVWRGITKANYTDVQVSSVSGQSYLLFNICGSAQAATAVATGDMPTGGTVTLSFTLLYEA